MNRLGVRAFRAGNREEAREWASKAAAAGDTDGMDNLANMLEEGDGGPKDPEKAREWFRKAAEAGHVRAMNSAGRIAYRAGEFDEAFRWAKAAAEQGNPTGMHNLGVLYAEGKGVAASEAESLAWYRKAADAGYRDAMTALGAHYRRRREYAQALDWYRKAADLGDNSAMHALGVLYLHGRGVTKAPDEARKWFEKSAEAGNAGAKDALQPETWRKLVSGELHFPEDKVESGGQG
jgi:tetratricopeptide (TPR) repeat protein